MSKILLACGGTGGHLAPGIALAESLQSQNHETLLMVSSKIVDQQMTAKYRGLNFVAGRGRGFGPGLINKILFFPSLFGAIYSSLKLVRQFRPSVLICFGGFMSLGPAIACKISGIPILVHEANRRPGKAVRLIARFAQSIHLPYGVRIKNISAECQHDSGFPVRQEITPTARDIARQDLNFPNTGRLILVTGGSQGAQVLTRWVESNHDNFNQKGIHVLCLTGAGGREGEVNNASSTIRYLPFCNQMASAYSASDIAITRSGAGTLAELATCRTPAVLVPYAFAADDHQTANAVYAVEAGMAQMIPEKNIEKLNNTVFDLLNEPTKLQAMKEALARADAHNHWEKILKEVLGLAQRGRSEKMKNSIWMLGACGMGVGPLAIYLKESGNEVYGWDDSTGSPMENHLANADIPLLKDPWAAGRKPNLIGRSSAVKLGHAALALAEKNQTRVLRRGELLAESVADKKFVAVCGSHGKTTTCGLIISALATAGIDFGYVLGGLFRDPNFAPAHASQKSPWVVAEVDESDGTISHFSPDITVAVNLDWDHPDYYKDEAALEGVFRALFERTTTAVVIPTNNERLERLTRGLKARVIRVGETGDFTAQLIGANSSQSRLLLGGEFKKAEVSVPVTGAFNRANASMALAVTHLITGAMVSEPLTRWRGIRRRQDILFEREDLLVLADYAHHPTEIAALLKWIKETHEGQLIVIFQPHRHTRTRQYASEFRQALHIADAAFVLPVYSAGEVAMEGGRSDAVVAGSAHRLIEDRNELSKIISPLTKGKKTVVAFVGAGDIEHDAENYALILRREGLPVMTLDFGEAIAGKLSANAVIRASEPLHRRTTLGVGGVARWYAEPATVNDIIVLLQAAGELGLPYFVIGRGSNLLVLDEGYDGLIIHLNAEYWGEVKNLGDGRLQMGAGARLKEICGIAARDGLTGFEFLEGIPGTMGGSLRMNAGAMGSWIFDRVESIDWLTPRGIHRSANRNCFDAMYRDCPQLHGAVILSAVLKSTGKESLEKIRQTMDEMSQKRRSSQPRDPSAGCVFKNPDENHAGRLIESAGLKGTHIGAAEVSNIHGNFIINKGDATAKDVLALMKQVRAKVQHEKHQLLQPEIIVLGKEWKDLL